MWPNISIIIRKKYGGNKLKTAKQVQACRNLGAWRPYARHYSPRSVFFLPPFYIEERFILQTKYVLKMGIVHFLSLKSAGYSGARMVGGLKYSKILSCVVFGPRKSLVL